MYAFIIYVCWSQVIALLGEMRASKPTVCVRARDQFQFDARNFSESTEIDGSDFHKCQK